MQNLVKCVSLAILLAGASTGASAALIDQGNTTLDDVAMLEWLDLTVTQAQDLTVNEFLADQGGFISAGWNFANVEQVQGLLGQVFNPFPDDTGFVPSGNLANQLDAVNTALSLFGETDPGGGNPFGEGLASDTLGLSFTGLCQPFYQKTSSDATRLGSYCIPADVGPDDDQAAAGFGFGIWAYRDVAPIPIPAAAWLFGSALGLLGWMRHKAA